MVETPASDWHKDMKCQKLTPDVADKIFFPKPGGKSKTARLFCESCPVEKQCLEEALRYGGPGFWAGTTEDERRRMIDFLGLLPQQLDDFIPPVVRRRLRAVKKGEEIRDLLADLEGPTEDELKEIDQSQ
jgi:WhiB family redox-sensing transcriptional regulator